MICLTRLQKRAGEIRALTNLVGNAMAAVAVARWEGEIDLAQARRVLDGEQTEVVEPEASPAFPVLTPHLVARASS